MTHRAARDDAVRAGFYGHSHNLLAESGNDIGPRHDKACPAAISLIGPAEG